MLSLGCSFIIKIAGHGLLQLIISNNVLLTLAPLVVEPFGFVIFDIYRGRIPACKFSFPLLVETKIAGHGFEP